MVLLNCIMTFLEEVAASKVIDSFSKMLPAACTVIRDGGKEMVVPAEDLVPGDIVIIHNGEKCPADLRLLHVSGLKAETSSLTGEAEPINCNTNVMPRHAPTFECKNLCFNGSLCLDGAAIGVVITTGDKSLIGSIANLATNTVTKETIMQIEMRRFVYFIGYLSLATGIIFFTVGLIRKNGDQWLSLLVNGFIVIVVANVSNIYSHFSSHQTSTNPRIVIIHFWIDI
jgi:sodium/potassium-transporting ATPase subunit alpha